MAVMHNRIRYYRKKMRLTQAQLAEAVGVCQHTVFRWECGRTYPDVDNAIRLSRELKTTVAKLYGAPEEDA